MTPNNLQISQLEKIYQLANKEEIVQFLAKYPELLGVLIDAEKPIRKHFGEANLDLRFAVDAENDTWQTLFVKASHKYSPQQAREKRLALIREWFIPLAKQYKQFVTFTESRI